jgi:hypothetical protein
VNELEQLLQGLSEGEIELLADLASEDLELRSFAEVMFDALTRPMTPQELEEHKV